MNRGRGFQNSWWLIAITLGTIICASLAVSFWQEQSTFAYMVIGESAIILPIIVGIYMKSREAAGDKRLGGLGFCGFDIKLLPLIILLSVTMQSFSGILFLPIQAILTLLFGGVDYEIVTESSSFAENFVVMCLLAPIFEEILCRGVLMSLLKRYGTARMLIYSSLGFALLHLDMQSFIPIFMIGLLFGTIRITTGSVLASIIAHSASNLYSLVAIFFDVTVSNSFFILSVILFPILLLAYFRAAEGRWRNELVIKGSKTGVSVGMIIVLSIFLIFNFILLITRFFSGEIYYDISSLIY